MQTVAWTDDKLEQQFDRIDERFRRVDERFDEVDRRITEGWEETKQRFDRVEGDIRELKQGLAAVQVNLNRFIVGAATGWVVLMVTILVKGG